MTSPEPIPANGQPSADEETVLGRVAAPPEYESTSGTFYFWVDRTRTVERTQIVSTHSEVAGRRVDFVGVVQEVYRRSRQRDIGEEAARFDSRSGERPPFDSEGVTYAEAAILRTDPVAHTPPLEESVVHLATPAQAARGYGVDRMGQRFDVGLLRNGGTRYAGTAAIDLDFLLGKNGGHLNVNGIAGLGTKSSLLMQLNWLLLREAERRFHAEPAKADRLQVVPIIFNVKNFDLFFIDRPSQEYRKQELTHRDDWRRLGVSDPGPFQQAKFFAPQMKKLATPVNTGRVGVEPYSWSLADVIEQGLLRFLFSEDDIFDANFGGLVGELEEKLSDDITGEAKLKPGMPQTFQELLEKVRSDANLLPDSHAGTRGKLLRRLKYIVQEGDGVLRRNEPKGKPLVMPRQGTAGPLVIDLYGIVGAPSLQRFVVAAVFHQLVRLRSDNPVKGLRYLITLDELNRFAPRGGSDPITAQIETVAAEMRSQGVILLGAQQQASLVSSRVIENSAIRAIGRSGTLELTQDVWRFLSPSARSAAAQLQPDEKMLYQPSFREPMLAKIPFPPFALNSEDAAPAEVTPQAAAAVRRIQADVF